MEHNHSAQHPHHLVHSDGSGSEPGMEQGTAYNGYYQTHEPPYADPYHPHIHQTFQFTPQHPGPPSRQMSDSEVPPLQFQAPNIMTSHGYGATHAYPEPHGIQSDPMSPQTRHGEPVYDPISPHGSDSSASHSGVYHHSRASSASGSASSSRGHSLVHRSSRYNPTPSPTSSSGRRRARSSSNSDEEDMGQAIIENLAHTRKEATRKQRIEAEQRRRDDLRDGYAKLKDALPISNQKNSKVSLLERACNHIRTLETGMNELRRKVEEMEKELIRLRAVNEAISLHASGVASPGASETASMGMRSMTPTGEVKPEHLSTPAGQVEEVNGALHSLAVVKGQEPPRADSPMSDKA